MIQFNAGTARITPNAEPCEMIAVGSVRFSSVKPFEQRVEGN